MARKKQPTPKSSVVSLRISDHDKRRWDAYCEAAQITYGAFFSASMLSYMDQDFFTPIYNGDYIRGIESSESRRDTENSDETELIHFRINESLLKQWDELAKQMYFSRSSLIIQVTRYFFRQDVNLFPKPHLTESIRLVRILNNIIEIIGIISYPEIRMIFEDLDQDNLVSMLDTLEQKGYIGQKARDVYVPVNPRSETLSAQLASAILERIADQVELSAPSANLVDIMRPSTILRPIFNYLDVLKDNLNSEQYLRNADTRNAFIEAESQIKSLKLNFDKLLNLMVVESGDLSTIHEDS